MVHRNSETLPDSDHVATGDAVALIELVSVVSSVRQEPRAWRMELLSGMSRLLHAPVCAALMLRDLHEPIVTGIVVSGFRSDGHRQAFHDEFGSAPFRDPFSKLALEKFVSQRRDTLTVLRADLVDDGAWGHDVHVLTHRRGSGLGDCALSLHRARERTSAYVLCAFRHVQSDRAPGAPPGGAQSGASRFGARERVLLHALHSGIAGFYRAEESSRRTLPTTSLPPRLRQTLEHLLAGLTERQAALKMDLSVHTLHGYVKNLYSHFGVSSRGELLAKWIGPGGKPSKD